ncbi:cupin domain-containing protein [Ralstonia syzygii subsp. celebesensis]|uniref:Cupin domain-containing protein n=3 Tax=Ralstonia solanacearum species complex TaxID=3116862 RepID=A0AAD0SBE7_RALSL|nr:MULTISPECIES: cupin domain-containing protein [Ralstonia solanacearum species complex]CCA81703.1 putative Cupin 2, conserved barrel domain protein precursor (exported protein) [blood disease bacterium R229]AQW31020.1 cupin [blood disease bacterium A2-HR MARDI]AXV83558.1 cupin domain-containing protein [Ralstonia solanacearum]AXW54691.1 cupin domain-containing protein [Ralstonia solanacearum]QQV55176.1 cupin domain-containing protein [Ralstonia syzygii subsp. celebesensis]
MKPLIAAAAMALSVLEPAGAAEPDLQITRAGTRAVNVAPAQTFTGNVTVEMLYTPVGTERASAGTVRFSPGARTAWHSHPLGQTLIVTAGIGRIQRWGGPVEEIRVGDVVHIPPNTKHWHGAAPDSAMTHIAITEALNGTTAEWMERVTDAQYGATPARSSLRPSPDASRSPPPNEMTAC